MSARRIRRSMVRHARRKNPQARWLMARHLHRYADRYLRLLRTEGSD